jgi:hypothetical protein
MKAMKNILLAISAFFILVFSFGCEMPSDQMKGGSKIVVQNYYWAKPGLVEEVYQQRLLASAVRGKYGHPVGRVLRLTNKSDSLPDVIWECEYPGMKARGKDIERLSKNEEFSRVADKMGTLIVKFDRAIYEVSVPTSRVE